MHSNPDNIEAYFIQGDPNLASAYEIQEDIIWCKTEENVMPGILNKTLLAIECMIPRIGEFDYILRPNLSSFYVFPRFLQFLKTLPRNGCYCGYDQGGYATGCGYLMSSDVAEYLVINQDKLKHAIDVNKTYDDVALGEFFKISNIALIPAPRRDLCNIRDWLKYKKIKSTSHFHFRVKNNEHKLRATVDVHILNSLLQQFYGLPSKKYSLEKNKNEKGRNKVEE
ncbi:MAG: hypothetical protein NT065_00380 [Chlamydiae bacterium]|nr:hypothetical protein [Chlamydiota bacterium]